MNVYYSTAQITTSTFAKLMDNNMLSFLYSSNSSIDDSNIKNSSHRRNSHFRFHHVEDTIIEIQVLCYIISKDKHHYKLITYELMYINLLKQLLIFQQLNESQTTIRLLKQWVAYNKSE